MPPRANEFTNKGRRSSEHNNTKRPRNSADGKPVKASKPELDENDDNQKDFVEGDNNYTTSSTETTSSSQQHKNPDDSGNPAVSSAASSSSSSSSSFSPSELTLFKDLQAAALSVLFQSSLSKNNNNNEDAATSSASHDEENSSSELFLDVIQNNMTLRHCSATDFRSEFKSKRPEPIARHCATSPLGFAIHCLYLHALGAAGDADGDDTEPEFTLSSKNFLMNVLASSPPDKLLSLRTAVSDDKLFGSLFDQVKPIEDKYNAILKQKMEEEQKQQQEHDTRSSNTDTIWHRAGKVKDVIFRQKRVITAKANRDLIVGRHFEASANNPLVFDRVDSTLTTYWNRSSWSKVFVVSGSSGSGKTVHAVLAGKRFCSTPTATTATNIKDPVVLYLTPCDIVDWTGDKKDSVSYASTTSRNDDVSAKIEKAIISLLEDEDIKTFDKSEVADFRVVVIFDEMGSWPVFVRGLCSVAKKLALQLHRLFFTKGTLRKKNHQDQDDFVIDENVPDRDFWKYCHVHFIVAGTGLVDSGNDGKQPGSSISTYTTVVLDDLPLSFSAIVNKYFPNDDSPAKKRLLRLDKVIDMQRKQAEQQNNIQESQHQQQQEQLDDSSNTTRQRNQKDTKKQLQHHRPTAEDFINPSPSSTELNLASLVKNVRCAAILCARVCDYVSPVEGEVSIWEGPNLQQFWSCGQVFDQVLTGMLPTVIAIYVQTNGLNRFLRPENTLLCALAAHAFYLHDLPRVKLNDGSDLDDGIHLRGMLEGSVDPQTELNYTFPTVWDALSIRGGILGDRALRSEREGFFRMDVDTEGQETHYLPPTGRYRFSEPHCAMLYSLMGITRRPQTFSGFEESVADCCALLAAASPFYSEMRDCLSSKSMRAREDWIKFVRENADPLIDFKLAFDFPHAMLTSDYKLAVSYYQNKIKLACAQTGQAASEDLKHNRNVILDVFLRNISSSSSSSVAVFLSAPLEPFADVVVVGPHKLILIQCKSRSASNSTKPDVEIELAKIGLEIQRTQPPLQAEPGGKKNKKKKKIKKFPDSVEYLDKLVERCRIPGVNKPVEIEVFVITAFNQAARLNALKHEMKKNSNADSAAADEMENDDSDDDDDDDDDDDLSNSNDDDDDDDDDNENDHTNNNNANKTMLELKNKNAQAKQFETCCQPVDTKFGVENINEINGVAVTVTAREICFQCDAKKFRKQCLFPAVPNVCTFYEVEPPSGHAGIGSG